MTTLKPFIGIPCRRLAGASDDPPAQGVRSPYIRSVIKAGGIPILLPLGISRVDLEVVYQTLDGILLPGGEDVAPQEYGEKPHPNLGKVDRERDELELQLVRLAHKDRKPLLGICRGIQVMNVALGGSLWQDLPSEKGLNHNRFEEGKLESWSQPHHKIECRVGSLLEKVLGADNLSINSLHHQAIKELAPSLQVSGNSDDGVVEAVEDPSHPFFLGVQGHPEIFWQNSDERWLNCFTAFINACAERKK